jgi:hypothetical protein
VHAVSNLSDGSGGSEDLLGISEAEAYVIMSRKAQFKSPEDWQEFCALPLEAKQAVAKLYRDAIFSQSGPSAWDDLKSFLSEVSTIFGEASGIAQAAAVLIAL